MPETEIGIVSDFFAHPVVAGIDLTGELRLGDQIRVKGSTTDLEFQVQSMQIDHANVDAAQPGQAVGVTVPEKVRRGDRVYKLG